MITGNGQLLLALKRTGTLLSFQKRKRDDHDDYGTKRRRVNTNEEAILVNPCQGEPKIFLQPPSPSSPRANSIVSLGRTQWDRLRANWKPRRRAKVVKSKEASKESNKRLTRNNSKVRRRSPKPITTTKIPGLSIYQRDADGDIIMKDAPSIGSSNDTHNASDLSPSEGTSPEAPLAYTGETRRTSDDDVFRVDFPAEDIEFGIECLRNIAKVLDDHPDPTESMARKKFLEEIEKLPWIFSMEASRTSRSIVNEFRQVCHRNQDDLPSLESIHDLQRKLESIDKFGHLVGTLPQEEAGYFVV